MNESLMSLLNRVGIEQLAGIAVASTVLCLAGLVLLQVLCRKSASVQSGIWQATGSAIVLTALVLVVVPGIPLQPAPVASPPGDLAERAVLLDLQQPETTVKSSTPDVQTPVDIASLDVGSLAFPSNSAPLTESVAEPTAFESDLREPVADLLPETRTVADRSAPAVSSSGSMTGLVSLLAAMWLVVMLPLLVSFVRSTLRCRAVIAAADDDVPDSIRQTAQAAGQRLSLTTCPRVAITDQLQVPFTAGLLSPVVILPAEARDWSSDKLTMVIAHEFAHVERRDVVWHWIGRVAICLAWFNPLVWMVARRGFLDRERACDDRVIAAGFSATLYGECLVEVAGVLSRRATVSAAVSMAEPPLKQRLQCILSPATDRRRESTGLRTLLLTVFCGLAVVLGVMRPLATAPAANTPTANTAVPNANTAAGVDPNPARLSQEDNGPATKTSDDELIELTLPVTGTVTYEDGHPITDATVVIKLLDVINKEPHGYRLTLIKTWQVTTNASGRYSVDVSALGPLPARYIIGPETVDKPGFARSTGLHSPSIKEVFAGTEIRPVTMQPGRRVTGKIVSADGEPVAAVVAAAKVLAPGPPDLTERWGLRGSVINASGQLAIDIPKDADVELMVYSEDHAPQILTIARDENDLGIIELSVGSIVTGTIVDRSGKPCSRVVVRLNGTKGPYTGSMLGWSRVALSDAQGRFRLAPGAGKCRLSVDRFAILDEKPGYEVIDGETPPLIMPVEVDLSEDREVILQEAKSYRITGTARWDDGTPAADFEVQGGVVFEGSNTWLATATTGADGRYELRLPKNSTADVMGIGAYRDDDRSVWYQARSSAPAPVTSGGQIASIDKLESDLDNVNWDLQVYRAPPTHTAAEQQTAREFKALQKQVRGLHARYPTVAAAEQAQVDPREVIADKYLTFEQKHRGSKEAMKAIVEVLRAAGSEGRSDLPISKARLIMIDRLIKHYMGHEDLPNAFGSLHNGVYTPRSDDLLRMAAGRSPHEVVRASALLARAEHAKEQLRSRQWLADYGARVAALRDQSTWLSAQARRQIAVAAQRRLNRLIAIDPDELRSKALLWLETIERRYNGLTRSNTSDRTFGQEARALRHAIERVNNGQPAPQFEATDINGKRFRLQDHAGKVVVVAFHQSARNAADKLPHQFLADRYSSESMELVTIVATSEKEAFLENLAAVDAAGTVIWEPFRGSLQSNWGVAGFPTTFVIDQGGTLHSTRPASSNISGLLRTFIKDTKQSNTMHRYLLKVGETVCRVAPPFPTDRLDYYRTSHPRQAEHMPDGPSMMILEWDGQLKTRMQSFGDEGGATVGELLWKLCDVGPQLLRGDQELLLTKVPGDFVVAHNASREDVIADLQKILTDALNQPVTLTYEETKEEVYVARGEYQLSDLAKERGMLIIKGANQGGHDTIEDALEAPQTAMRPEFDYFVESSLAEAIGYPVINEVEDPPDVRVFYKFLRAQEQNFRLHKPDQYGIRRMRLSPAGIPLVYAGPVLESVSEQTGLTFTKEFRQLKTLTVTAAGDDE